ncbi:phosphoethanolamine transferase [Aureimonas glaciei]|uniref:Phosphoethanolamine transferase n=1 Tax=Aureimonas glaciei TaxID=1776957 RepID=A0A916XVX2_9HYPH|nr:phosphoethanolamine--lipid A transferase [Aureimonas glaciei]GGD15884.1 phosphoethanolamine transferase [Aureimonas glaciei]
MPFRRPAIGSVTLAIVTSAFLLLTTNAAFWRKGMAYFAGHETQLVALGFAIFLLSVAILTAISVKYLIKPAFILLVLISAVASYFTDTFGITIDRDMIRNAVVTTSNEARQLLTPDLALHLLLFGLIPSAAIGFVRVVHRPFGQKFWRNCAVIMPSLIAVVAILAWNYATFSSTFRERGDLMASLNPAAPIVGAVKYAGSLIEERDVVVQPYGVDARQGGRFAASRPALTVIVVGETARAQNYSLNGYARETNPAMKAQEALNFRQVSSCGTATAVSLPCMFSGYRRTDYSNAKGLSRENLLDVLTHAGLRVDWFDNNTGSKGVADRVAHEALQARPDPVNCREGDCWDQVVVERLKSYLSSAPVGNAVVVLHLEGSHGPAYYQRIPPAFARFQPACATAQFGDCSQAEIVAAYDNTILYTDHILSEIVDLLKAKGPALSTAMVYMSDHGESLGENGLYLHAAPYFIAPDTQTHVPFLAWLSDGYLKANDLDSACLRGEADRPLSHDNLFHTVLGMTDVKTAAYDAELDAFQACRHDPGAVAAAPAGEVRS